MDVNFKVTFNEKEIIAMCEDKMVGFNPGIPGQFKLEFSTRPYEHVIVATFVPDKEKQEITDDGSN